MAGLRNKWPCNGFLVETEQEGAAGTLRETFDKFQYAWQNILAFHGSEERFSILQSVAENKIAYRKWYPHWNRCFWRWQNEAAAGFFI